MERNSVSPWRAGGEEDVRATENPIRHPCAAQSKDLQLRRSRRRLAGELSAATQEFGGMCPGLRLSTFVVSPAAPAGASLEVFRLRPRPPTPAVPLPLLGQPGTPLRMTNGLGVCHQAANRLAGKWRANPEGSRGWRWKRGQPLRLTQARGAWPPARFAFSPESPRLSHRTHAAAAAAGQVSFARGGCAG